MPPHAHRTSETDTFRSWEQTSEKRLHHDLRQSLGLLMALAEGVRLDIGHDAAVLRLLDQMRREVESMADLVRAHGESPSRPQCVDVGQVVIDRWRSAVPAAACRMQLVCDAAAVAVVSPVELARSVQNLIANAVRAAGDDGTVVVQVWHHGDTVTVTVSDTGPGFGKVPTHQGLGLSTVRRFAAECGGSLSVVGSSRGGARLMLRIPSAAGRTRT